VVLCCVFLITKDADGKFVFLGDIFSVGYGLDELPLKFHVLKV
jgi:hypothetical protein